MQVIQLQNESVVEIATFLVRRWSEEDKMIVEISDKMETITRLNEKKIILTPLEKRIGNDFQKYRQFRTSLWYEAMRVKFCKKILSNDHAFGKLLDKEVSTKEAANFVFGNVYTQWGNIEYQKVSDIITSMFGN